MGPSALIGEDVASGRLITPFPHLVLPARSYCAYFRTSIRDDGRIIAFCDWLERHGEIEPRRLQIQLSHCARPEP
jgi:LysR family glycine cleavage system transcriptional activator